MAKLGTGLDNIDQELCRKFNIRVINAPGMNAASTAEFTVMQILNVFKNSFSIYDSVKKRDFRRALYCGREFLEYSTGIIGYGNVGRNIAERIISFVKKVYIFEKKQKHSLQSDRFHFITNMDTFLSKSDVVILAISLKDNEKLVNRDFISKLKKDDLI